MESDHNRDMLARARQTLELEAEAILAMRERLNGDFVQAVQQILACTGRVVVTGMGKSGIIGHKIAATLSSTGTPALYLHPGEGIHGDLGMLTAQDCVIALSNSGETAEVLALLPVIKRLGTPLIAILGRMASTLARQSDVALDASVAREACPLNLAPTSSTTAALALGDALAVALLEARGFSEDQFALFHPGGALGRKLLLKVEDLMHHGAALPQVARHTLVKDALWEMTAKRLGLTAVLEEDGRLAGIITDGDLRRQLEDHPGDLLNLRAEQIMTVNPKAIQPDALAAQAVHDMETRAITALLVVDAQQLVGVIHLHDLLRAGVV
ncbi:KpsF/GutQ family protein [Magnetococcus marinus MC-1]|uniref:KpsF/GutQ family protein n=1 Tax=Magnetococcus marinus (strain ATCC BAA-1437 / JCM 17883 / MC-1) TaxID=156889 RepID=A0LCY2_MAGMM|nr:KpsF/GutQ family sugar-phosphate isomerase [Magnetococcus marinus]ABK45825.1 KpsF/GutQ family protein [Magnetococcus marinus MC-1]